LLALKRFLDERAGGLIEFFLSSDDESIGHGTIWPAEVRAALDRMALMLIFVSSEALKSGWTYFEAGFGMHKLGTANVYCLPGTKKDALPSPFNVIQNRNLHSAREVSLLLQQINLQLDSKLNTSVTKGDFDRLFMKPVTIEIQRGQNFEQVVRSLYFRASGPPDSINVFERVCRSLGLVSTIPETDLWERWETRCSTGLKIEVDTPKCIPLEKEVIPSDEARKRGVASFLIIGSVWQEVDDWDTGAKQRTISELEAHNADIAKRNLEIKKENAECAAKPRSCRFTISPYNDLSVPLRTVDAWLVETKITHDLVVEVQLYEGIGCEMRAEAISAKIHGSPLSLRDDGTLLWAEGITVQLPSGNRRTLTLTASDLMTTKLSQFHIPELVSTLFELNILYLPVQRGNKRK